MLIGFDMAGGCFMYHILSFQDLKSFNNSLSTSSHTAVRVVKIDRLKDKIFFCTLDSFIVSSRSFFYFLKDYFFGDKYYITNLMAFSKLDFQYLYTLFNPKEASSELELLSQRSTLAGVTDPISIGPIVIKKAREGWELVKYTKKRKVVYLPEFVTVIGKSVFAGNSTIEWVESFAPSLAILENAFYSCEHFIGFGSNCGISRVEKGAFEYSEKFSKIQFSEELIEIGSMAFNHTGLRRVEFPASLMHIHSRAFGCSAKLVEVFFPEGSNLRSIGPYAFEGCKIKSLDLSNANKLKRIGNSAFSGNRELRELKLPRSIEIIDPEGFGGCSRLAHIDLSNTKMKELSPRAFDCCPIEELRFPRRNGGNLSSFTMHITSLAFYENPSYVYNLPAKMIILNRNGETIYNLRNTEQLKNCLGRLRKVYSTIEIQVGDEGGRLESVNIEN